MKAIPLQEFVDRCHRFVDRRVSVSTQQMLKDSQQEEAIAGTAAGKYSSISEIFLSNHHKHQDENEYLVVTTLKTARGNNEVREFGPLKCVLPATLRSSTKEAATGLIINDIPICAYTPAMESLSVLVYKIRRTARTERTLAN